MSSPKHLMVDLETLSTRPNAVILSIAGCAFDPAGSPADLKNPDNHFYRVVQIGDQEALGRHIDNGTLTWWHGQSEQAQREVFDNPAAVPLHHALHDLLCFAVARELDWIWSFGATADIVWLKDACDTFKLDFPFHYRKQVCMRTVTTLSGVERPTFEGTKHNALFDAISQCVWAQRAYDRLMHAYRIDTIGGGFTS